MLEYGQFLGFLWMLSPPTTTPQLSKGSTYDFAAMIPVQVSNCLSQLKQLRTLIIGGARCHLARATLEASHTGRMTYGMTKTPRVVAIRQLLQHIKFLLPYQTWVWRPMKRDVW